MNGSPAGAAAVPLTTVDFRLNQDSFFVDAARVTDFWRLNGVPCGLLLAYLTATAPVDSAGPPAC